MTYVKSRNAPESPSFLVKTGSFDDLFRYPSIFQVFPPKTGLREYVGLSVTVYYNRVRKRNSFSKLRFRYMCHTVS